MATSNIVIVEGKHIIDNLEVINTHIDDILRQIVDPHLKKFLRGYTQQTLKIYPPVPPQSTYIRTGELRRGWDVTVNRYAGEAAIVNRTEYAKWVIGKEQTRFHGRTGWLRLADHEDKVIAGATPVISKALDSEIRRFLFSRGLM